MDKCFECDGCVFLDSVGVDGHIYDCCDYMWISGKSRGTFNKEENRFEYPDKCAKYTTDKSIREGMESEFRSNRKLFSKVAPDWEALWYN